MEQKKRGKPLKESFLTWSSMTAPKKQQYVRSLLHIIILSLRMYGTKKKTGETVKRVILNMVEHFSDTFGGGISPEKGTFG